MENIFIKYFEDIFISQNPSQIEETVLVVKDRIIPPMFRGLIQPFTSEEIYCAIKDMKGLAAPGPDGIPSLFYHHYWEVIGNDITQAALDVLNKGGDLTLLNNTHICLIPKAKKPLQS